MSTVLDSSALEENPGFERPAVDLPNTGQQPVQEPLRITVRPNDYKTIETPEPTEQEKAKGVVEQQTFRGPNTDEWRNLQGYLSSGASRDQIAKTIATEQGMEEKDADLQVVKTLANKARQAYKDGANEAQVLNYMLSKGYDRNLANSAVQSAQFTKRWELYDWTPNKNPEQAEDLVGLYKNVYSKYSTDLKGITGLLGSRRAAADYANDIADINNSMVKYLNKQGFNASLSPSTGEVMITSEDGYQQEVSPALLDTLWNSKYEIVGSTSGALAGAQMGARFAAMAPLPPNQAGLIARAAIVGGFAYGGGAIGGAAGRGLDLAMNSYQLKEELEAGFYFNQMTEAGLADIVMGTVGATVLKTGAAGVKATSKNVLRAYDFVAAGNKQGAVSELRKILHLSDDQAKEIVDQFESKLQTQLTTTNRIGRTRNFTPEEREIAALASTQQGAESIVRQATANNPQAANAIKISIDKRAKDINAAIENISDPNTGALIRQDLNTYQKDVKDFYGTVKQQGADAIDGTDFRFDINPLAIQPMIKSIQKGMNPRNQELFMAHVLRIEDATTNRTFSGLLDLRQAINDFKYSKTGLKTPDIDAINKVINKIDVQINKAAKQYMPDAKQWAENWQTAKTEYAKMKQLEENVLFKRIQSSANNEAGIQRVLNKWGNDTDVDKETFNAVAERLSPKTRSLAETAAIKNLANKYTYGTLGDYQATNFVALNDAIKELNLTSNEAKYFASLVDEMSKLFKNDPNLSSLSGNLVIPRPATALTDDLATKARWSIMSTIWNEILNVIPGRQANSKALVKHLGNVLENPMHFKSAEDLIKAMPETSRNEMRSLINELRAQTAKQPAKQTQKLRMYKQTKSGKLVVTDGALGKGVYLVDKVVKPNPDSKVISHEVDLSRLANTDTISSIVGRQVSEKEIRTLPEIQQKLRDAGYLGIRSEGKAMLFPELIPGNSFSKPIENMSIEEKGLLKYRTGIGYLSSSNITTKKLSIEEQDNLLRELANIDSNSEEFADLAEYAEEVLPLSKINLMLDNLTVAAPRDMTIYRIPGYYAGKEAVKGKYVSAATSIDYFPNLDKSQVKMFKLKKGSKYVPENTYLEKNEILVQQKDLIEIK